MLYRTVPKNGDELSILGFGCMRLPLNKERQIDEPRAIRQIRDAIDQGVNYLDTAWPYHAGESENVLGRALSDGYRERVKIATKLPSWMIKKREDMDFYLNAQLEKEVAALDTAFDAQAEELEEIVVRAKTTDIHVPVVALAWMPYAPDSKGRLRPAWASLSRTAVGSSPRRSWCGSWIG